MRTLVLLLLAGCGEDLPPVSDLSGAQCRLSSGRVCGYDSLGGCPAEDPCNWCDCSAPGGAASCTLVACLDAGFSVIRCQTPGECPAGQVCAFDPGCAGTPEPGRCTSARECTSGGAAEYCGCDGKSFTSAGPCANRPHTRRGGC